MAKPRLFGYRAAGVVSALPLLKWLFSSDGEIYCVEVSILHLPWSPLYKVYSDAQMIRSYPHSDGHKV